LRLSAAADVAAGEAIITWIKQLNPAASPG